MLHSLYSYPVLIGYYFAQKLGKPYGLWPHGVLAPFQRSVSAGKKYIYNKLIVQRILRKASVLFFTSHGELDEARAVGLKPPFAIIPEGIDVEDFKFVAKGEFRAKHLSEWGGSVVLYLGRLNAKKGIDLLIRAFKQVASEVQSVRLVIVGQGDPPEFEHQVRRWVGEARIGDRVTIAGRVAHPLKLQVLADADILVMPSHAENFGFAMFEAMASRIPVVISDTLNLAYDVQRHGAGLVVNRSSDQFATAIVSLLRDPERRQIMGQNGFKLAESYSWENCARKIESVVSTIIHRAPFWQDYVLVK
jgi:glycosyltransferase involved in cell wall biosynthesis